MDDKIYLDKNALKVLVSNTRVNILKRLNERRRTVTELSRELNLAKATVHEHLSKLSDAGLIKRDDSQHKWVYYELTRKGREILHPHEATEIGIFIASALLAFIGGILGIYRFIGGAPLPGVPAGFPPQIVHEPAYLIAGLALISISTLLSYLAFRIWRRPRARF